MNFFAEQKLTHRLKNLWLPKGTGCWGRDGLGVWDGNIVKLGCNDGCTTINIIKFIELTKRKKTPKRLYQGIVEPRENPPEMSLGLEAPQRSPQIR